MSEQIRAIIDVITHPKETMRELPSDRLFFLAFLAPLYFALSRAYRPRNHELLLNALGGEGQLILAVTLIALILIPFGAWLVQQFLKLFKKRLSVRKLMNIYGYALVPRLLVALIGYVILLASPAVFPADGPSVGLITIIILGVAGMIYSLWLHVYGIVVSPSESNIEPSDPPEVTAENLSSESTMHT